MTQPPTKIVWATGPPTRASQRVELSVPCVRSATAVLWRVSRSAGAPPPPRRWGGGRRGGPPPPPMRVWDEAGSRPWPRGGGRGRGRRRGPRPGPPVTPHWCHPPAVWSFRGRGERAERGELRD